MKYRVGHNEVRAKLKEAADGLTVNQIAAITGLEASGVRDMLKRMPDTYIDRWELTSTGRGGAPAAVWCVVDVPADCPRPGLTKR